MKKRHIIKIRSFTLLELMVVIAIIVILASMFLPALRKSREKGYDMLCKSNLKQSGLAHSMYMNDYNEYLPANKNPVTNVGYNHWGFYLSDYMNNKKLFHCPSALPKYGGSSYNDTSYYYGTEGDRDFKKLRNLRNNNPNYYPLAADSSHTSYGAGSLMPYCQIYTIGYSDYLSPFPSSGYIFLRHNAFANVLSGDGKVESVNKAKMLKSPYTWTVSGGFRAWMIAGYNDF